MSRLLPENVSEWKHIRCLCIRFSDVEAAELSRSSDRNAESQELWMDRWRAIC